MRKFNTTNDKSSQCFLTNQTQFLLNLTQTQRETCLSLQTFFSGAISSTGLNVLSEDLRCVFFNNAPGTKLPVGVVGPAGLVPWALSSFVPSEFSILTVAQEFRFFVLIFVLLEPPPALAASRQAVVKVRMEESSSSESSAFAASGASSSELELTLPLRRRCSRGRHRNQCLLPLHLLYLSQTHRELKPSFL